MSRPSAAIALLDHRNASVADQLFVLFQQSYKHEAQLIGVIDFPPLRRNAQDIQAAGTLFWGYSNDGSIDGVIEASVTPATLHIDSLAVLPALFGNGMGTALITHVLKNANCETAEVQTAAANFAALALYRKMGFKETGSWLSKEGITLVSLEFTRLDRNP